MTNSKKIEIAIIWLVTLGLLAFLGIGSYDLNSKGQYYDEVRSKFENELKTVTKLIQIFELEKCRVVKDNKVLTIILADHWKDTLAGAYVTASYQIEGENIKLVDCASYDETQAIKSFMMYLPIFLIIIGILLTILTRKKTRDIPILAARKYEETCKKACGSKHTRFFIRKI